MQTLFDPPLGTREPPGRRSPEESANSPWSSTGGHLRAYPKREPLLCPKRPFWVVCDTDAERRAPASCDSYQCLVCGPRKARLTADLAAWSLTRPEARTPRFLTLHDAPDTHKQRLDKMRNLKRVLSKDGIAWEAAWVAEPYPEQEGAVHIHAMVHGPRLGTASLRERVTKTWGQRVYARSVPSAPRVQAASTYMVKTFTTDREAALDLNGGRSLHTTAGFHHGLTRREVMTEMRAVMNEGEILDWHLERGVA